MSITMENLAEEPTNEPIVEQAVEPVAETVSEVIEKTPERDPLLETPKPKVVKIKADGTIANPQGHRKKDPNTREQAQDVQTRFHGIISEIPIQYGVQQHKK